MDHLPPEDQATASLAQLRRHFASGATLPLPARLLALQRLGEALKGAEDALLQALQQDLGKPPFEAWCAEILPVRQEIAHVQKQLRGWMKPQRVATGWLHWPARAALVQEPLGAVLILSPWNYPVQLALLPLISAIAAGNTVLLKPSELAPATAALLARLVREALDPEAALVLTGDAALAARLTALPWDHVFFTGSVATGRAVAAATAANLVPCTLELGGCNPCIVEPSADPRITARRIVWGKFLNAGQTCIAPNHVLVHDSLYPALLEALRQAMVEFYGADGLGLQRLANARQFARLAGLLDQGRILQGGAADTASLHLQPTLMVDVAPESRLLQEEIFGPILPVLPWHDEALLLDGLARAPSPLAVYLHGRDARLADAVQASSRSGGFVRNDHVMQAAVTDLPFGGVGSSGQGRAHGRAGFETFSNARALYRQSARIDLPMRYPPYGNRLAMMRRMFR